MHTVETTQKRRWRGAFPIHSRCGWPVDRGALIHRGRGRCPEFPFTIGVAAEIRPPRTACHRFSMSPMISSTFFLKAKSAFMEVAILSQPCITVV